MPELARTLPGFALIKKKQLLDVRKGFKWEKNNFYYLMPDGSFSETAENEKFADFVISLLYCPVVITCNFKFCQLVLVSE